MFCKCILRSLYARMHWRGCQCEQLFVSTWRSHRSRCLLCTAEAAPPQHLCKFLCPPDLMHTAASCASICRAPLKMAVCMQVRQSIAAGAGGHCCVALRLRLKISQRPLAPASIGSDTIDCTCMGNKCDVKTAGNTCAWKRDADAVACSCVHHEGAPHQS